MCIEKVAKDPRHKIWYSLLSMLIVAALVQLQGRESTTTCVLAKIALQKCGLSFLEGRSIFFIPEFCLEYRKGPSTSKLAKLSPLTY